MTARPGSLSLENEQGSFLVTENSSAWWRRLGFVDVARFDSLEAQLVTDESPHIFVGALAACQVRFVDQPHLVAWAELKQHQLAVAQSLGIPIPSTVITNQPVVARSLADKHDVVAKAVSPGSGIAPYVGVVLDTEFGLVSESPTLLQELVRASADYRIVVVANVALIWRRIREDGVVDWRQIDPAGEAFTRVVNEDLSASAILLTTSLGLTISIQDWLETTRGPVFLESNAQGAWAFLADGGESIAPLIAKHLASSGSHAC